MPSVAVLPGEASGRYGGQPSQGRLKPAGIFNSIIGIWKATHISSKGKYSTSRVGALHDYCQQTSFARALAVCVFTPVPALLLLIMIEMMPLRDPSDGWQANYIVWLRLFLITASAGMGSVCQIQTMVPALSLTWKTVAAIGAMVDIGCTLVTMTTSALSVFPLPFTLILEGIPFQPCFVAALRLAMKGQDVSLFDGALRLPVYIILLQPTFAVIYTVFGAVFELCTPSQQTILILGLSLLKLLIKNLLAWVVSSNQDLIPVIVIFTAEMFNALYVSICMQLAVSGWTSVLVIALDAIQAAFSLMEIYKNTKEIQATQQQDPAHSERLLSLALRTHSNQAASPYPAQASKLPTVVRSFHQAPAISSDSSTSIPPARTSRPTLFGVACNRAKVTEETRKLMFHSEYLVLVEYVECAIPTLYAVYLFALAHLPNAKYYPHARSLNADNILSTVDNLLLYASLETLALVGLHVLLKHRYGFSPLHQLAFVLETEVAHIQGRLFVWIVGLPQFTLEHFDKWLEDSVALPRLCCLRVCCVFHCLAAGLQAQISASLLSGSDPSLCLSCQEWSFWQHAAKSVMLLARRKAECKLGKSNHSSQSTLEESIVVRASGLTDVVDCTSSGLQDPVQARCHEFCTLDR